MNRIERIMNIGKIVNPLKYVGSRNDEFRYIDFCIGCNHKSVRCCGECLRTALHIECE